jgi:osmotically inducible protein OsmC
MPRRNAHTQWTGGLEDGVGVVTLVHSGIGQYSVSFPRRAADESEATTSPEELIAAAHSSCFAMQCSALIAAAGGVPVSLSVMATVSLGPDPAGGFHIPGIALEVEGVVSNMTEEEFIEVCRQAKDSCPVSKALTGTTITIDARFAQ